MTISVNRIDESRLAATVVDVVDPAPHPSLEWRDPFDHVAALAEAMSRRLGRDIGTRMAKAPGGMRGSYGRILSLMGDDGIRPALLADGAQISKQAIAVRLRELIELGWVRSDPDPDDGRATIVRATAKGRKMRELSRRAIEDVEREWAEEVGPERFAVFKAVLTELTEDYLPAAIAEHRRAEQ